ncbi:hypothetical protein AB0D08_36940 [Kitasatospora sp. NPDC048540]|uniref:hypothetical protein n=1 Tax=Kitasatospora sp. NPDC048540 TaxID=3155634 RepID=UPI0033DB356A
MRADRRELEDTADLTVCREAAFRAVRDEGGSLGRMLGAVEELLADEADREFAVTALECVQNLVSHGLPDVASARDAEAALGPRGAACWRALADFWTAAAAWNADSGREPKAAAELLTVENPQLRLLLWTSNRSLPDGRRIGLADILRFEQTTGSAVPGFSHLPIARQTAGQG